MSILLEPLLGLDSFKNLISSIKNNNVPALATGVIESQKCHLIHGVNQTLHRPVCIITYSELRAKHIFEDMQFFAKNNAMIYPSKDIIFYNADVKSSDIVKQRFAILEALISKESPVVILSVEALFDKIVTRDIFSKHIITLSVGDVVSLDEMVKKLVYMGYERTELVEGHGQFAVRGGIIDLFSSTADNAVRIEFFGDEIDSIRMLDSYSQRSIEKVEQMMIYPMRELLYDEPQLEIAIKNIVDEFQKVASNLKKKKLMAEYEQLTSVINEDVERLREQKSFDGVEKYINYFYHESSSFFDYLEKDTVLFFDEPLKIESHAKNILYEFNESISNRILKGYMLPNQENMVFSYVEILSKAEKFSSVLLMTLTQSVKNFKIKNISNFTVKPSTSFNQKIDLLYDELVFLKSKNYKTVVLSGSRTRCERLLRDLLDRGLEVSFVEDGENTKILSSQVIISKGNLSGGFEYPDIKFAVISDKDLFGEEKKRRKVKTKKKGAKIENFTDLKVGDYVVHDNNGIGIYKGIEKITVDNITKDFLKIGYANDGNLYVPISQMDMIQKYIAGEDVHPKLNKLGGADWKKAKAKVRGQVAILAKDLVALYAKRQATDGYSFSEDNVWQREFEDMFVYEETDDQLLAISDVKSDMESKRVMDRLVCGDVGYGKTEVAIRAAFKAVQDGKQVAYLVPTTILAQQHYNNFAQRMSEFPITVDTLSRFRSKKEQTQTVEGLKKGLVDIVIGTHRILSKDMVFKDLGLVIVDEEQRFGVTHKEKLKALKGNVDVLTLTATPIPRTLHMSLAGIRDMSILQEPPQERQPIQTYVMEYNEEFVKDAIHRELARGGQVYYLHNRVRNIDNIAQKLQLLVPEASVAFAHGQMSEHELENIMMDFVEQNINVLVCTTIIETGLDIPNVNTIIIQDADHMGLSQLYQLRGRVGRSNRIAYAYLMYKKDKVLQEIAEKRLQTIKEFTEFGSGFKIAMRDLEIRGAGNLLGAEQHGHMDSVGYDMYCKLLDAAVKELKGEVNVEDFETSIDVNINAFIPVYFIENELQKLEIYKKISLIQTTQDYYDVEEEIEDRYGDLPISVKNLLDVAIIKAEAHSLGIVSIAQKQRNILVVFKEDAQIEPEKIATLMNEHKGKVYFTAAKNPYLTIKTDENNFMSNIKIVLQGLKT